MGLLTRLREAVATSAEPQLQRGGDTDDLREGSPTQAERDNAAHSGDAFPDGSFPITTQKQADDAWRLRGHNEHHTEASIVAHIRKQVAKHGLTMPGDKTREASPFRIVLREAALSKTGGGYEATIVREGPGNPGDSNYYTKEALRKAVAAGMFEGLQGYLNHPTPTEERERPERDVRYLAGHFREARYVDGNPAEVRGKFIPGGMEKDGVVSLVESALQSPRHRPLIGISIDGYGHAPDQQTVNGRTYNMVREITHLGSADIVTRAGAGGQFHRRLQEQWRNTDRPTGGGSDTPGGAMKPATMQEQIKTAARKLQEAAGLDDKDSTRADTLVNEALATLRECADSPLEVEVKEVEKIREVQVPVPASTEEKDVLAAKVTQLETKLQESATKLTVEQTARKTAEDEASTLKRGTLAVKVLRECKAPKASAEAWFEDVAGCDDEPAMRKLVERKMSERDALLTELRESIGVEGNPARPPASTGATGSGGLLDRMGIDRDELAAA